MFQRKHEQSRYNIPSYHQLLILASQENVFNKKKRLFGCSPTDYKFILMFLIIHLTFLLTSKGCWVSRFFFCLLINELYIMQLWYNTFAINVPVWTIAMRRWIQTLVTSLAFKARFVPIPSLRQHEFSCINGTSTTRTTFPIFTWNWGCVWSYVRMSGSG